MYIFLYVDLEIFAVLIGESAENTIMQMELSIKKENVLKINEYQRSYNSSAFL